jgi:hypothetical protein
MTSPTRMTPHGPTTDLSLTAQPEETTAGAIVLLVATVHHHDSYAVAWEVRGPTLQAGPEASVALLGLTKVAGARLDIGEKDTPATIRAMFDTTSLTPGLWQITLTLTPIGATAGAAGPSSGVLSDTAEVLVAQRPFSAGDDVSVRMRRAGGTPTADQPLWVSIRTGTEALGIDEFTRFMDGVSSGNSNGFSRSNGSRNGRRPAAPPRSHLALPFANVDQYRLLKASAEMFIMINCRTDRGDFHRIDPVEESARLEREVSRGSLEAEFRHYLVEMPVGDGSALDVLPYLALIRRKLGEVPVIMNDEEDRDVSLCYGILSEKLTHPCFLELVNSYWTEMSGLMRTMQALNRRFQNRAPAYPGRDPLADLEIDPLRPLNNILWGWAQDEQHRLTVARRESEYQHLYGLSLGGGPSRRVTDVRSRFMGAFHNLLAECMKYYDRADNTVIIANAFDVLNGLKEVHLLLTQGAHNQYGDLPSVARQEMLMSQWILGRPETAEFLRTRVMDDYSEPWIGAVEAMNRLQGWSDQPVQHFRDLAAYAEQLLLGIRFGAWTGENDQARAGNWAQYFRPEVQQYCHAYQAVTGQGLSRRPEMSSNGYGRRPSPAAYRG